MISVVELVEVGHSGIFGGEYWLPPDRGVRHSLFCAGVLVPEQN